MNMHVWIGYTPEGFLLQVAVGDFDADPLGKFGDTHVQVPDETARTLEGLDASDIHRSYCWIDGRLQKLRPADVGKVWYPDTKHFIDPATRGKGPIAVNPNPPVAPTPADTE